MTEIVTANCKKCRTMHKRGLGLIRRRNGQNYKIGFFFSDCKKNKWYVGHKQVKCSKKIFKKINYSAKVQVLPKICNWFESLVRHNDQKRIRSEPERVDMVPAPPQRDVNTHPTSRLTTSEQTPATRQLTWLQRSSNLIGAADLLRQTLERPRRGRLNGWHIPPLTTLKSSALHSTPR